MISTLAILYEEKQFWVLAVLMEKVKREKKNITVSLYDNLSIQLMPAVLSSVTTSEG